MRINLREIAEAASYDPKAALMDRAGNLDNYEIGHNLVLVATYVAPDRIIKGFESIGGLVRTDRDVDEDRFQGKVALVLKCGPQAFLDIGKVTFSGFDAKPGDWIIYRPSDAMEIFISNPNKDNEGISCRLIEDVFIKMKVSDPSLVY